MTTADFRSDRGRCLAIKRMMDLNVFKQLVEAIFTDLDLTEAHLMNQNLSSPTANVEMRLTNQRKGYNDCINAMKMCCDPIAPQGEMPPETYGAEQTDSDLMKMQPGWEPLEMT